MGFLQLLAICSAVTGTGNLSGSVKASVTAQVKIALSDLTCNSLCYKNSCQSVLKTHLMFCNLPVIDQLVLDLRVAQRVLQAYHQP